MYNYLTCSLIYQNLIRIQNSIAIDLLYRLGHKQLNELEILSTPTWYVLNFTNCVLTSDSDALNNVWVVKGFSIDRFKKKVYKYSDVQKGYTLLKWTAICSGSFSSEILRKENTNDPF